jgi:surfactin synthase thioesterase subunit
MPSDTTSAPSVRLKPNAQARLRLFCFPFAGGGASLFYSWAKAFPPTIDVCPVQLPGRENRLREPPPTHLVTCAQQLARELPRYFDLPYALLGYSLGSLMCFELARALRRARQPAPVHFLVGAGRAPHVPYSHVQIHRLPDPEFVEALSNRYDGMRPEVLQNAELMKMCLPSLKGDVTMLETYEYTSEPPLACPISACGGMLDYATQQPAIAAWEAQTTAGFKLRMFPGGHFFLNENRAEYLAALLEDLKPYL